jgi:hypothetical protein
MVFNGEYLGNHYLSKNSIGEVLCRFKSGRQPLHTVRFSIFVSFSRSRNYQEISS